VAFVPRRMIDEHVEGIEPKLLQRNETTSIQTEEKLWEGPKLPAPLAVHIDPSGATTGYGLRKSARAAATVRPGTGKILVNGKNWVDYFQNMYTRGVLLEPIIAAEKINQMDVHVRACGGGFQGQAEAARLAIANAFVNRDPEMRFLLLKTRMMKRDVRLKERKHTGKRAARKKQAWVKR